MNITGTPVQEGFADAVMLTLAGIEALTTMVIAFDVAGFPVVQRAFDV